MARSFTDSIGGLLALHGAFLKARKGTGLTAHQLRVLMAVYYIDQENIKPATRKRVAVHTYLWLRSVIRTVADFIDLGYIEPLVPPSNHIRFAPKGLELIKLIEKHHRIYIKQLEEGKPVKNKAK